MKKLILSTAMISTITFSCGFLAGKYVEQQQCPERVIQCSGIRELNKEQNQRIKELEKDIEVIRKSIESISKRTEAEATLETADGSSDDS